MFLFTGLPLSQSQLRLQKNTSRNSGCSLKPSYSSGHYSLGQTRIILKGRVGEAMWYETLLVLLDLMSLASSCNGVCLNFSSCNSVACYLYGGILWYTLSALGSLAGVLDIVMNRWSADVTATDRRNIYLQFHYFLAWVAIIVGYPLFVTATWLAYSPSFTVHLHLLCVILPLLVWSQKASAMVAVTEMCLLISLISHFYISVSAGNAWCLLGALIMAANIFFLCFSNRYSFFGIHSKEAYIITSAAAYYTLARSIQAMVRFTSMSRPGGCGRK